MAATARDLSNAPSVITLRGVNKWFGQFHVLSDINLDVKEGEKIVVCGPSGSGKSTLIRCINRLEEHQAGDLVVHGVPLTNDVKNIEMIRREVGMVFQSFNLFPHLTILDNLTLAPIWVKKMPKKEAEEIAMSLLTRVRIPEQALKYPGQLSGGQQQRVAIARALANDPPVLIADEPTGNLDSKTANAVFQLFEGLVANGKTVVMVTHDSDLAKRVDRAVIVADGAIVNEYVAKALSTLSIDQLALVTRQLESRTYTPGAPIISQGETADQFYIITKGQVEVLLHQPNGPAIPVTTMSPGQYFGEIGLLRGGARTATVRAAGEANVEVVALDHDEFNSLIADSETTKLAIDRVANQRFLENSAVREREVAHA